MFSRAVRTLAAVMLLRIVEAVHRKTAVTSFRSRKTLHLLHFRLANISDLPVANLVVKIRLRRRVIIPFLAAYKAVILEEVQRFQNPCALAVHYSFYAGK